MYLQGRDGKFPDEPKEFSASCKKVDKDVECQNRCIWLLSLHSQRSEQASLWCTSKMRVAMNITPWLLTVRDERGSEIERIRLAAPLRRKCSDCNELPRCWHSTLWPHRLIICQCMCVYVYKRWHPELSLLPLLYLGDHAQRRIARKSKRAVYSVKGEWGAKEETRLAIPSFSHSIRVISQNESEYRWHLHPDPLTPVSLASPQRHTVRFGRVPSGVLGKPAPCWKKTDTMRISLEEGQQQRTAKKRREERAWESRQRWQLASGFHISPPFLTSPSLSSSDSCSCSCSCSCSSFSSSSIASTQSENRGGDVVDKRADLKMKDYGS